MVEREQRSFSDLGVGDNWDIQRHYPMATASPVPMPLGPGQLHSSVLNVFAPRYSSQLYDSMAKKSLPLTTGGSSASLSMRIPFSTPTANVAMPVHAVPPSYDQFALSLSQSSLLSGSAPQQISLAAISPPQGIVANNVWKSTVSHSNFRSSGTGDSAVQRPLFSSSNPTLKQSTSTNITPQHRTKQAAAAAHARRQSAPESERSMSSSPVTGATGHQRRSSNIRPRPTQGRRRRTSDLARDFWCPESECQRRYEAWRSLQHHLRADHGLAMRLRQYRSIRAASGQELLSGMGSPSEELLEHTRSDHELSPSAMAQHMHQGNGIASPDGNQSSSGHSSPVDTRMASHRSKKAMPVDSHEGEQDNDDDLQGSLRDVLSEECLLLLASSMAGNTNPPATTRPPSALNLSRQNTGGIGNHNSKAGSNCLDMENMEVLQSMLRELSEDSVPHMTLFPLTPMGTPNINNAQVSRPTRQAQQPNPVTEFLYQQQPTTPMTLHHMQQQQQQQQQQRSSSRISQHHPSRPGTPADLAVNDLWDFFGVPLPAESMDDISPFAPQQLPPPATRTSVFPFFDS